MGARIFLMKADSTALLIEEPRQQRQQRGIRHRRRVAGVCAVLVLFVFALVAVAPRLSLSRVGEAFCRRNRPHKSHRCKSALSLFSASVFNNNNKSNNNNNNNSNSSPLLRDSLRLSLSGLYVEAPSSLAVNFDKRSIDPHSIQLHYKLKTRDVKLPKFFAATFHDNGSGSRALAQRNIHDNDFTHNGDNVMDDNATALHEFKKCRPDSLLDSVAFFSSKCVDFMADYKSAANGKRLIYKFKVLAKKLHKKFDEADSRYSVNSVEPHAADDEVVLLELDADDSESAHSILERASLMFKKNGNAVEEESRNWWSTIIDALKPKKPSSKFVFLEQQVDIVKRPLVPWPFANEDGIWPPSAPNAIGSVAHNFQTYGEPYIHGGFDIRTAANASCHSPVAGLVVKIVQYNPSDLYFSIMIQDEYDFIWQFHHLDPNSFTVEEGDFIKQGHVIGKVIFWPELMNGANYHHTHMNVARAKNSWNTPKKGYPNPYIPGWKYYNPFSFFNNGKTYKNSVQPSSDGILHLFSDRSKPSFAQAHHMESVNLMKISSTPVKGTIHAVTHLITEFSPSNDIPGTPYFQCPHEIIWFVSKRHGSTNGPLPNGDDALDYILKKYQIVKGPLTLSRFDRLPPAQWPRNLDAQDKSPLRDLFKYEFETSDGEKVKSQFDYVVRKPYYSVTNTVGGEIGDGEGSGWDTKEVGNGEYVFHVIARDWFGEWGHWTYPLTVEN
ncbi:UNVERIFIED_CONTAM: hypothetical protein HDU68_010511 [Siphonaria sp. JEL0065]|nr:hypothetical protein HDU68_010511 [Siphonaria sp. JEL0065]